MEDYQLTYDESGGDRRRRVLGQKATLTRIFLLHSGLSQNKQMPPQLTGFEKQVAQVIEQKKTIGDVVMISTFSFANIFFAFAMNYIWDLLNDISFLMILSYLSVNVPGLVQTIQSVFLSFIYMDLLQTDVWLNSLIYPDSNDEVDHGLNAYFELNGLQSTKLVKNLGSTFVFLVVFLFLHIFYIFLVAFFKGCFKCCDFVIEKLGKQLYWGGSIRFIIQQFTPLALASLINLQDITYENDGEITGVAFSFIILFLMTPGILLAFTVIGCKAYRHHQSQMEFNRDKAMGQIWNLFVLFRWVLTLTIIVILREHNIFQILALLTSISSQLYLVFATNAASKSVNAEAIKHRLVSIIIAMAISAQSSHQVRPKIRGGRFCWTGAGRLRWISKTEVVKTRIVVMKMTKRGRKGRKRFLESSIRGL
ncbi:hypothetical protein FGO68_gene14517 [Halteria grandinella]|uniref:Uncharacterized protein n=1 Tax=Halteria grandinella TaxID=5974 RepID=A0A8J8P4J4_HALGN|nr:hypothetical protein FGO68_gene14517 [Halteria grandinella]